MTRIGSDRRPLGLIALAALLMSDVGFATDFSAFEFEPRRRDCGRK